MYRRSPFRSTMNTNVIAVPFRSTMNTNVITALGMCKVCTEAIHSVARKRQDWTCESTCEHENAKTRKRENGRNQPVDAKTAKTRKRRKRRKQENRENGENAKTAKTRKRENGENDENPKTAKSVPVFWFSISRFLVFSVFSVFWFSRFLVFSFRWPHPSGQVAFFMCLENIVLLVFSLDSTPPITCRKIRPPCRWKDLTCRGAGDFFSPWVRVSALGWCGKFWKWETNVEILFFARTIFNERFGSKGSCLWNHDSGAKLEGRLSANFWLFAIN